MRESTFGGGRKCLAYQEVNVAECAVYLEECTGDAKTWRTLTQQSDADKVGSRQPQQEPRHPYARNGTKGTAKETVSPSPV
jgi:hypothetical protein